MSALDIAQQYFDGWNARDPQAVLATMAPDGTYSDPASGGPVSGEAFAAYMTGLFAGLPDVSFEVVSMGEIAGEDNDGLIAAQWIMRGTNSGPFMNLPPSGKSIEVSGSDFIKVSGGKIQSVQGYFDAGEMPRQLGLQVVVQPHAIGPFQFGTANRTWGGKKDKPGAMSVTILEARTPEETAVVQQQARMIAQEMLDMKGFLGLVGATIGDRMMTISAWEHPDDPSQMMRGGQHAEALKKFFGPEVSRGGFTGTWVPHRLNTMHTRCDACQKMTNHDADGGKCACGADLPEQIAYW